MHALFYYWLVILILSASTAETLRRSTALDLNLYKEVLNPEECNQQLNYMVNNTSITTLFLDAGVRLPRGVLDGNKRDMGNYFQCLKISKQFGDTFIEGKYTVLKLPISQNLNFSEFSVPDLPFPEIELAKLPWLEFHPRRRTPIDQDIRPMRKYTRLRNSAQIILGGMRDDIVIRNTRDNYIENNVYELAFCIPKVCTIDKFLNTMTMNLTANLKFSEYFTRLPNDKPWATADYIAMVIISIIGILTLLSTSYNVYYSSILDEDPKEFNKNYIIFSVYTNTRKFFTFDSKANMLDSLDGIRSLAMTLVIIGHTFFLQIAFVSANPLQTLNYIMSLQSVWLTSATITVDTFFCMSGILLVYTTSSKLSKRFFVRNLHLFYLNRLLRLFPVLATVILIQASFLQRVADGPYWLTVATSTNNCRQNWWSTLLYVQNFVSPEGMCIEPSWYLAVDMQLYIISPLILFWILDGDKKISWMVLIGALLGVLSASTIYNFIKKFPSASFSLSRPEELIDYFRGYYLHTLPRASPFCVGMCFGYLLHLCKGRTIHLPKIQVTVIWITVTGIASAVILSHHYVMQPEWDNQTVDSLLNSFMRPVWASCIGWLVFACTHGYGGPINWILTLHVFKVMARLSYAMYIIHFPLIILINATTVAPIYFSVSRNVYRFVVDFFFSTLAAFVITIVIDIPCTTLIRRAFEGCKSATKKIDDIDEKRIIKTEA